MTQSELESRIQVLLGGTVAEEMTFNDISSGAQNDLERATEIGRSMVMDFGMSKLGRINFRDSNRNPFLVSALEAPRSQYHSEQTAREIDQEVRTLIQVQYDKVKLLLTEKKERIEVIARALLERETLDAEELKALYEGREIAAHVHRAIIPTYAEKEKAKAEKRKAASIFGGPPKPATS